MRHVYFAFHYADIWRVNQVRNSGVLFGPRSVGFADRSLWEKAKTKGRPAMEKLILTGLEGTSATVVLIGERTADRAWVQFEIERSHERNNALVGIRIHHLKNSDRLVSRPGRVPELMKEIGAPVYRWSGDPDALGGWVEDAVVKQCL